MRTSYSLYVRAFCASDFRRSWLQLPQAEKAKIAEQLSQFPGRKSKLDAEVSSGTTVATTSLRAGQADVHDHDGDDGLHPVSSPAGHLTQAGCAAPGILCVEASPPHRGFSYSHPCSLFSEVKDHSKTHPM